MHTVQLLLKTSKYERHEINRRFHALAHLHNVCVKHAPGTVRSKLLSSVLKV